MVFLLKQSEFDFGFMQVYPIEYIGFWENMQGTFLSQLVVAC